MNSSRHLPRRSVLKGLGATLALPFLDAMVPAFARAAQVRAASPTRMAFVYVPNGIVMDEWAVPGLDGTFPLPTDFPRILQPAAAYRDQFSILSGLMQDGGRAHGDGPGDHARAGASYLTSAHPKETAGADIQAGVSVDQVAAQHIGHHTRFPSLELGCEEGLYGGNCDGRYSCAYSNTISWRTPSAPMPQETSPRAVFERMFGGTDLDPDPARRARRATYNQSVLDLVLEQAKALQGSLGATDRRKLDEYLFSVRDIEKRIVKAEQDADVAPPELARPRPGVPQSFIAHARLMFDLMTVAFQTDMTRVITFMIALELGNKVYEEAGVSEAHHGLTHHRGDAGKIAKITRINRFHVEQFTHLLGRLSTTNDGDGTLLDHSMVVYGAGISDGNRHHHHDLPTLLAGRAGGRITQGRHTSYPAETPMANLFVTMLDHLGVEVETLGDSTGRVTL
jgi:hypothetical protein